MWHATCPLHYFHDTPLPKLASPIDIPSMSLTPSPASAADRSIFTENLDQFRRLAEAMARDDAAAVASSHPRQEATDGVMAVGLSSVVGEPPLRQQQEWEDVDAEEEEEGEEEEEEEGEEEEMSLPEARAESSAGELMV